MDLAKALLGDPPARDDRLICGNDQPPAGAAEQGQGLRNSGKKPKLVYGREVMDIDDKDPIPVKENRAARALGRPAHRRWWAGDGFLRARTAGPCQCLKWRIPVVTIAIPAASATAATSASRTDPPG